MTLPDLVWRSFQFRLRSHLGTLAGVIASGAILVGALAVGDSVRESLKLKARERTGPVSLALLGGDRFFRNGLLQGPDTTPLLQLLGTVNRQDGEARVNQVQVLGVDPGFWTFWGGSTPKGVPTRGHVALSAALAEALRAKVDDELILRITKPSALSRDAVVTPRDDQSVALRLKVSGILTPTEGDFSLTSGSQPPMNAWVDHGQLAEAVGLTGLANVLLRTATASDLLGDEAAATQALGQAWTLADGGLSLAAIPKALPPNTVELATRRIFLEPPIVQATERVEVPARRIPILTYLVNGLRHGDRLTPYSMVTAAGAPYTPADLQDDEIVINDWLAQDLRVKAGDPVEMTYFRVDAGSRLTEHTQTFRVRQVVPMKGVHADRTLMPEFPGLAKAESTRDWDAGFELVHTIRDEDETYWKQWRGTPKAFVSLRTGQRLWANRFGDLTAVRWIPNDGVATPTVVEALTRDLNQRLLKPEDVGLVWRSIAGAAQRGATGGQDFGGLFIGFSFFLIVSALLLTAMLFRFALDRRGSEIGILVALGWRIRRVQGLIFLEGVVLSGIGAGIGAAVGIAYARGILWGLSTLWRDAVAGAGLGFHLTWPTLVTGMGLSTAIAAATLGGMLRALGRRSPRELLQLGGVEDAVVSRTLPRWIRWGAWTSLLVAVGLTAVAWSRRTVEPQQFFGAGALWLITALLGVRITLARLLPAETASRPRAIRSLRGLALRSLALRPARSIGTISLLASATFLIIGVAAHRLDAGREAGLRSSGTGGFALWGETTLPLLQDLNTAKGREFHGLESEPGVSVVPFRVRDGDEASCLNLNRAQRPRILGVDPALLAQRQAFTFTRVDTSLGVTNGWLALDPRGAPGTTNPGVPEIPAIGDANSLQWALHLGIGDTLEVSDERGRPVRLRIVGAVANSILQGSLIVSEADFTRLYPGEGGHRTLLIDAPNGGTNLIPTWSRALQDVGLELTPTVQRLDRFNAVQNTYLNTFQMLGGLGLLLGTVGLGVVVARNIQERRGELALMQAVGFPSRSIGSWLALEHGILLLAGIGIGTATAAVAVWPSLTQPGSGLPVTSLAVTLAAVLASGCVCTAMAVGLALRRRLIEGLKEL